MDELELLKKKRSSCEGTKLMRLNNIIEKLERFNDNKFDHWDDLTKDEREKKSLINIKKYIITK